MYKYLAALLILLTPLGAFAQSALWQDVKPNSITLTGPRRIVPNSYRTVRLNKDALMQLLARAPMEFTEAAKKSPVVLSIPMPDGSFARFRVQQSPISLPDRSGKRSDFLSFSGQGIDDRTATLRGDISPAGFHAQIISIKETVYVDPFAAGDTVNCISYRKSDVPQRSRPQCLALPSELLKPHGADAFTPSGNSQLPFAANGTMLASVRTAIACTGEYTTFFRQAGDTDDQAKARALDAIKVTMNRVNGVWERDAAVRYVLLSDTAELTIIYPNGATDPYTNDNASMLSDENQANLDMVIMDANYDIGHVFATSPGGEGTQGVCVTGDKAKGVTGSAMPVGDPFDIDFVAHEIIHQWGGNHTFNESMSDQCNATNRNGPTAVEPGSGSTTASYAGICGAANLQQNSDDYFHSVSIGEILNALTNTATCAAKTATGNTPPTVTVPASFTIPQNTPFTLTATASDVDGDALTYGWEEIDIGTASPPNTDDGTRPLFRPYKPVTTPSRTFPSLTYILNNANTPPMTFMGTSATGSVCATGETCFTGEVMPVTTRTMNFRVQVRDNRASGGGINDATTQVNVRADSGPFVITAPNTAVTVSGGSQLTVTWDVANTNVAPVSATNVKITLSTDGGTTFPNVLSASTANNGSANVFVSNIPTSNARVKVEAVGNIFFDISDADFTITNGVPTPTPAPPTALGNISTRVSVQTGDEVAIGGFIVGGTSANAAALPLKVIVRGIGPSLANANPPVVGALMDPILELHDGTGATIHTDDNWMDEPNAQEIIDSTVAPTDPAESAIEMTLNPGNYTAIERGTNGGTGVGLVEVYDLEPSSATRLLNISTRGLVGTDDNVLIGGFIIVGADMQRVIVRAIGPSLGNANPPVPNALADPILEIHNPDGSTLTTNDNWRDTQEAEIIATTVPPTDDLESAIVATLPPGNYTAIVAGVGGTTGDALVEVFALAPAP